MMETGSHWQLPFEVCEERTRRMADLRDAAPDPDMLEQDLDDALAISDWAYVVSLLASRDVNEMSARQCFYLGLALWMQARVQEAVEFIRSGVLAHPRDASLAGLYEDVKAWRAFAASRAIHGGELTLEPLGRHHVESFALQYSDPLIATLCCLPVFDADWQFFDWLDEQYLMPGKSTYAVIHDGLGFVGVVSLLQVEDVGFFYYWIGPDFQGFGLGPRAVDLMLLDAATSREMSVCYAKVFNDNARSRQGLAKLGFVPLDVQAIPPHEDEIFYRMGVDVDEVQAAAELDWLLRQMDSEVRLAIPLAKPERLFYAY